MINLHFNECESTQVFLKNYFSSFNHPTVLVTTKKQTQGIGRNKNQWVNLPLSLAFSFSFSPHPTFTLSSIEIGVILLKFIEEKFQQKLFLKWPNDIMTAAGEKCGGIIIHSFNQTLIAGIGLNLVKMDTPTVEQDIQSKYQIGFLLNGTSDLLKTSFNIDNYSFLIPQSFLLYAFSHRLSSEQLLTQWPNVCLHQDKVVSWEEDSQMKSGIFKGIGQEGQALISTEQGAIISLYSGSLFL